MWDPEPWLQLHLLALRKNCLYNKWVIVVHYSLSFTAYKAASGGGFPLALVVHYSLDFTAYKAASGGIFFRCGILRVLMVHYSLGFTAYKAASGGVFLRCGILSLGYNCTSWPCAKMVSTISYTENSHR